MTKADLATNWTPGNMARRFVFGCGGWEDGRECRERIPAVRYRMRYLPSSVLGSGAGLNMSAMISAS